MMKGVLFYYERFAEIIERKDPELAAEFRNYYNDHAPNYVYLWLEKMRRDRRVPDEIDGYMSDFFWEIY